MTYPVEKGVPVPAISRSTHGRKRSYPFESLSVGDSFFVPYDGEDDQSVKRTAARVQRATTSANRPNKDNPKAARFISRRSADGIRVWRDK